MGSASCRGEPRDDELTNVGGGHVALVGNIDKDGSGCGSFVEERNRGRKKVLGGAGVGNELAGGGGTYGRWGRRSNEAFRWEWIRNVRLNAGVPSCRRLSSALGWRLARRATAATMGGMGLVTGGTVQSGAPPHHVVDGGCVLVAL